MRLQNNQFKKIGLSLICMMLVGTFSSAQSSIQINDHEAEALANEAYIYAYPLVTMDMTREVSTNSVKAENFTAPMGQFANIRTYPTASFTDVTAPNADTLYSAAWLDLSKEPYVLHVPDENGRYYLMPMLSGWTEVFADPGTRTTGTKAGDFAITGPNWRGELPKGVKEYKSPTNLVWIIGRTYSTGTPEDYAEVHKIQDQYSLKPLSFYGKPYTAPEGKLNPSVDMKIAVREQVNNLNATQFFSRFASLLKNNPPSAQDAEMVTKLAKIGIVPGQEFDINTLDPNIKAALAKAPKSALAKITGHEKAGGKVVNGWSFAQPTGHYGQDYLQRAFIAFYGLGANLPQDAIYPNTSSDNEGKPLSGENKYVLRFKKGQVPPVKGFWSLTMYNDRYFFVENSLNRYTLSPRDQLQYNSDGSLTLYIQHTSPGKDKESNWLPAPEGKFVLMFRFYWPEESLINGTWQPPAVERVNY